MMLSARELARIFFAGESDEARIVAADAFDECEHLGCSGGHCAAVGGSAALRMRRALYG